MASNFNYLMARMWDEIQFNFQGPRFTIMGPDSDGDGIVDKPSSRALSAARHRADDQQRHDRYALAVDGGATCQQGIQYQIFHQPIRSTATPLSLPEGIVIDLVQSGMGVGNTLPFGDPTIPATSWSTNPPVVVDPVIMFSPNGAVSYVGLTRMQRPTAPIFLLLGRRELMADVAYNKQTKVPEDKNFLDSDLVPNNLYLSNFWISIGYQTGLVSLAEMGRNPLPPSTSPNYFDARAFSKTSQSVGGQ